MGAGDSNCIPPAVAWPTTSRSPILVYSRTSLSIKPCNLWLIQTLDNLYQLNMLLV
jgi:hypothetical protein